MQLLEMVEMADQAHKLPAAVSGGQQQRAAIARALANEPGLIIADEPTGNLDSRTAESIFGLFTRLAAEGKTIMMVTHDEARAARTHRAVMIADGEVVNEHLARALAGISYDQLVEVKRVPPGSAVPAGRDDHQAGRGGRGFLHPAGGRPRRACRAPGGRELLVDRLPPASGSASRR